MPYASRSVGDAWVVRSSSTASCERTSVSRASQRRANAFSECFAAAVGLFMADTRKRAQRLMSARLASPSRDSRSSAGALTISVLRVIVAEVRPLRAVSLATLTWRIISTSPSAVFGTAVEVPARTDRAAASASIVSGSAVAAPRAAIAPESAQPPDARSVSGSW